MGITTFLKADSSWNLVSQSNKLNGYLLGSVGEFSVQNVVHGDQVFIFVEDTGSDSSEFFHMATDTEHQTEMDTHGSDVGTSFATKPVDSHISFLVEFEQLDFMDGSNSEFLLDGSNTRKFLIHRSKETKLISIHSSTKKEKDIQNKTYTGGLLEDNTGEGFEGSEKGSFTFDGVVESQDAHVFFT